MRALCGSIITAGALIGLGLAALGIGTRYQSFAERTEVGGAELRFLHFKELDTPLMFIVVVLASAVLVGLGIAFVGLAYHHERRMHERARLHGTSAVPTTTGIQNLGAP
jgi:hypothetical protein